MNVYPPTAVENFPGTCVRYNLKERPGVSRVATIVSYDAESRRATLCVFGYTGDTELGPVEVEGNIVENVAFSKSGKPGTWKWRTDHEGSAVRD